MPSDPLIKIKVTTSLFQISNNMQMGLFMAPSVAGWQAFYQEPSYYRLWLNATSLPGRKGFTDSLVNGYTVSGYKMKIDPTLSLDKFDNPSDPDNVVDEFSLLLFSKPVADNQKMVLRAFVLEGGTPSSWAAIYNAYKTDPGNANKKEVVINRMKRLLSYMMRMPEFHLS